MLTPVCRVLLIDRRQHVGAVRQQPRAPPTHRLHPAEVDHRADVVGDGKAQRPVIAGAQHEVLIEGGHEFLGIVPPSDVTSVFVPPSDVTSVFVPPSALVCTRRPIEYRGRLPHAATTKDRGVRPGQLNDGPRRTHPPVAIGEERSDRSGERAGEDLDAKCR